MLVEINLLQDKERKNQGYIILVAFVGLMIIGTLIGAYIFSSKINNEIGKTQNEINKIQEEIQSIETTLQSGGMSDYEKLKATVNDLQAFPIDTDSLIMNASRQLPEDGYFQSFDFSGNQITLQVLLRDDKDAAYYLTRLSNQDWVSAVKLLSISTQQEEGQTSLYTANYTITIHTDILRGSRKGDGQ
ncbi:PilN domain-containing protein [Bacillaceae bacterium S4-13-56]